MSSRPTSGVQHVFTKKAEEDFRTAAGKILMHTNFSNSL